MSETVMYVEAFIESELGYRWRFFDRDGLSSMVIELQQWDEATRTWKAQENAEVIFSFNEIEAVHKAMLAVKASGC